MLQVSVSNIFPGPDPNNTKNTDTDVLETFHLFHHLKLVNQILILPMSIFSITIPSASQFSTIMTDMLK